MAYFVLWSNFKKNTDCFFEWQKCHICVRLWGVRLDGAPVRPVLPNTRIFCDHLCSHFLGMMVAPVRRLGAPPKGPHLRGKIYRKCSHAYTFRHSKKCIEFFELVQAGLFARAVSCARSRQLALFLTRCLCR